MRRPVDQWFRLGLRGGIENQAYAKAMTANAAMTPITIKKSRTGAFPFEEQGEYKQGYPKSYKDQAIAERMWSVRTQGDIERCQGDKERCDFPKQVFDPLDYRLYARAVGHLSPAVDL